MSINRITLLGNVGGDPDVRVLDGGVKVASFTLPLPRRVIQNAMAQLCRNEQNGTI